MYHRHWTDVIEPRQLRSQRCRGYGSCTWWNLIAISALLVGECGSRQTMIKGAWRRIILHGKSTRNDVLTFYCRFCDPPLIVFILIVKNKMQDNIINFEIPCNLLCRNFHRLLQFTKITFLKLKAMI